MSVFVPQAAGALLARERSAEKAWTKLAEHLSPLVGDAGVQALLERSLTLSRAKFPWLALPADAPASEPPWVQLRACLDQQHPELAKAASLALLTTFLELLGRFIGEALALRLLCEVWPELVPETPPEKTT
jgi:hypothetical protein